MQYPVKNILVGIKSNVEILGEKISEFEFTTI